MTPDSRPLRLGLPLGSLNDGMRGNVGSIFAQAGYDIADYAPGSRSYAPVLRNAPIALQVAKPRDLVRELRENRLDAIICGADTMAEAMAADAFVARPIELVDLQEGKATLVIAVPSAYGSLTLDDFMQQNLNAGREMVCATEFPFLAQRTLQTRQPYVERYPVPDDFKDGFFGQTLPGISLQYGSRSGSASLVQIRETDGGTESAVQRGASCILDVLQSGRTLAENGLVPIYSVLETSARLYAHDASRQRPAVRSALQALAEELQGVVRARQSDYLLFDVPNGNWQALKQRLQENNWCSEEPSGEQGDRWTEGRVLTPKKEWPAIRAVLAQFGAKSIVRLAPQQVLQ